jgi:hypothetical protein
MFKDSIPSESLSIWVSLLFLQMFENKMNIVRNTMNSRNVMEAFDFFPCQIIINMIT